MRCHDFRVNIRCMANLLDEDNSIVPGSVCCLVSCNGGCIVVQTLCVLTLVLAERLRDLARFWSGHCRYWLVDRAVVWCAVIVYGENLWCLTVVMIRGCIPTYIFARIARIPCSFAVWGHACRVAGKGCRT